MSIKEQSIRLGHQIVGALTEIGGDARERWYVDEAGNQYGLRRGILTIVTADGRVI